MLTIHNAVNGGYIVEQHINEGFIPERYAFTTSDDLLSWLHRTLNKAIDDAEPSPSNGGNCCSICGNKIYENMKCGDPICPLGMSKKPPHDPSEEDARIAKLNEMERAQLNLSPSDYTRDPMTGTLKRC